MTLALYTMTLHDTMRLCTMTLAAFFFCRAWYALSGRGVSTFTSNDTVVECVSPERKNEFATVSVDIRQTCLPRAPKIGLVVSCRIM